jgi:hypothetical protein
MTNIREWSGKDIEADLALEIAFDVSYKLKSAPVRKPKDAG